MVGGHKLALWEADGAAWAKMARFSGHKVRLLSSSEFPLCSLSLADPFYLCSLSH